jgi:hypothetical protein
VIINISSAREYCEHYLAFLGKCELSKGVEFYQYLIDHGQVFTEVDLERSAEMKEEYQLETKQCFYNCQKMATWMSLSYYEGFACGIIPVAHAWLVVDGKVIDPTWEALEEYPGDYFGIEIPRKLIYKTWYEEKLAKELLWTFIEKEVSNAE